MVIWSLGMAALNLFIEFICTQTTRTAAIYQNFKLNQVDKITKSNTGHSLEHCSYAGTKPLMKVRGLRLLPIFFCVRRTPYLAWGGSEVYWASDYHRPKVHELLCLLLSSYHQPKVLDTQLEMSNGFCQVFISLTILYILRYVRMCKVSFKEGAALNWGQKFTGA